MVEEFAPKIRRQVISENTAAEMREILNNVSEFQPSDAAKISGYNIGIKTGTTQKLVYGEYSDSAVIGSMFIIAPIEDPQFVVLVLCDTPRVGHYGISTAGPVVNEISEWLLYYLNIKPDYSEDEIDQINNQRITVEDYTGWTLEDARSSLELCGLKSNIGLFLGEEPEAPIEEPVMPDGVEDEDENAPEVIDTGGVYLVDNLNKELHVVDQYPKPGMNVAPGGVVFLYWE